MELIRLSPSKLNLFNECPRCFHDAYTSECPRPRGIFPSLPGGMDLVMKKYFDQFREKLPTGLEGKLPGVLMSDTSLLKRWRFWKTGPTYFDTERNIQLVGALDDCLVDNGFYIPLDAKTKGSEPKDDGSQYYQTQLDCYNLMLEAQGLRVRDEGWLVYIYPMTVAINNIPLEGNELNVVFGTKPFKLACSRERAKEIVIKAAECSRGPRPKAADTCEHCQYIEMLKNIPEWQQYQLN